MKKMLIFMITVLILLSACSSTPRYKDAEELLAHWAYNGYPKEYCGVWSTDGTPYNLTIGLTDNAAGDKMERKIRSMVEDDSTLSFARLEHSYAELEKVQRAVRKYLEGCEMEVGVDGYGIYDPGNCIRVYIIMDKPGAQDFMDLCNENYPGMVEFHETAGYSKPA